MGCLRLGFSFFISLFAAAIFIIVGVFLGAFIPLAISSAQGMDFSSPLDAIQTNTTGALIGGGIGAVLGLFIIVSTVKRASDINWLKKNGTRVTAVVTDIEKKRESRQVSYNVGSQTQYRTEWHTYYVITARWVHPQTGNTHTFHSNHLNSHPKNYATGSAIAVLVDFQNPRRYLVEV